MKDKDQEEPSDHVLYDGVPYRALTDGEWSTYEDAEKYLVQLRVPPLLDRNDQHSRLFIASFDGTGNDASVDPLHATNVYRTHLQVASGGGGVVHSEYLAGAATRGGAFERALDGATGVTSPDLISQMRYQLSEKVREWRQQDPAARISVGAIGFSRGAVQAAVFLREVDELGIDYTKNPGLDGVPTIEHIRPGTIPMGAILLDPVSTGELRKYDRRLPDSVVTGLQITALSERRAKFPVDHIIPPGLSRDEQLLHVQVAGAHSDIGGSYLRHGLGARNANMMVDVINAWDSAGSLARKYPVPPSPRMNVVHRSQYGHPLFVFDRRIDRSVPPGYRIDLGPAPSKAGRGSSLTAAPVSNPSGRASPSLSMARTPGVNDGAPFGQARLPSEGEALRSHQLRWRAAGRALGGAATLAQGEETLRELSERQGEENAFAARQTVLDFGVTVGSGWAGARAGARAGASLGLALGIETGPGAFVTAMAGAAIGAVAANEVNKVVRDYRVYSQDDEQGRTWHFDQAHPDAGWTRTQTRVDAQRYDSRALPLERITVTADARTADLLDYKLKGAEFAMSLAEREPPGNPYAQEPIGDARHLGGGPWIKNLSSGAWTRTVVTGHLEHGLRISHRETAVPERAALLDRQADTVIAANVARSPRLHALHYAKQYEERGWNRYGPMEASARHIIDEVNRGSDTWKATDGDNYTRRADGAWTHPGWFGDTEATAHVAAELEARREAVLGDQSMRPHSFDKLEQRRLPDRSPSSTGHERSPSVVSPPSPFADPDMADLWKALQSGDARAISAACHRIDASPDVQAMHEAADRIVLEERAQLAQKEQVATEVYALPGPETQRRAPVMHMR